MALDCLTKGQLLFESPFVVARGRSPVVGLRGLQTIGNVAVVGPHRQNFAIAGRRVFRRIVVLEKQSQAVEGLDLVGTGGTGRQEAAQEMLQLEIQLGAIGGDRDGAHAGLAIVRVRRRNLE